MVSEIVQRVTKTYQQYLNLKNFFTSVINGEFNKKDQDFTKRFEQESQDRMSNIDHAAGISGTNYQAPLGAAMNKTHPNTHRHS